MRFMRTATGAIFTGGLLLLSGCGWFDGQGSDTRNVPPGNAQTSQGDGERERHTQATQLEAEFELTSLISALAAERPFASVAAPVLAAASLRALRLAAGRLGGGEANETLFDPGRRWTEGNTILEQLGQVPPRASRTVL